LVPSHNVIGLVLPWLEEDRVPDKIIFSIIFSGKKVAANKKALAGVCK